MRPAPGFGHRLDTPLCPAPPIQPQDMRTPRPGGRLVRRLGQRQRRVEADRWIAFRSHFGIESLYCRPGIEGAHEQVGVEGMIGYFRRNRFAPVPEIFALAGAEQEGQAVGPAGRRPPHRLQAKTVAEYFALERPPLTPLSDVSFETGRRLFTRRVDRYGQVPVHHRYSVPARRGPGCARAPVRRQERKGCPAVRRCPPSSCRREG